MDGYGSAYDRDTVAIESLSKATGMQFSDEQEKILRHHGGMCILACAGSGKALMDGTLVLTTEGYKRVEKLTVWDKVFDEQGNIQSVLGVFHQGKKNVVSIEFGNNHSINCCMDHLWQIRACDGNNNYDTGWKVINTSKLIEMMLNKSNTTKIGVPIHKEITFPCEFKEEVPGYLIGSLLSFTYPYVHGIYKELNEKYNNSELENLGLIDENKIIYRRIPNKYFMSSLECRRDILRGMIDQCGDIEKDNYVIHGISRELAEDIQNIVDSIGISHCIIANDNKNTYKVYIPIYSGASKLHTDKHRVAKQMDTNYEKAITNPEYEMLEITSINILDNCEEMTCIKVSGDSELFLTERCIPTHNTSIVTNLIAKRLMTHEIPNGETLLCTTYSKGGAEEMEDRLNKLLAKMGLKRNVQVKTMHALYLGVLKEFGYPTTLIDNRDRMKFIREACKDAEVVLEDDDLQTLDSLLSYQVNNLLSDQGLVQSYAYTLTTISLEQYSKIRAGYNNRKMQATVIDFDDMQLYMYSLLYVSKNEDVIAYCRRKWTDIYVDEAQDISRIQYAILKKMITDPNRLVVIGDDDQCLIEGTQVLTDKGEKLIEKLEIGDRVAVSNGNGEITYTPIDNKSVREIEGDIITIETEAGRVIRGTPEHIGFAKTTHAYAGYYVYLIYRKDYGYNLGFAFGQFKCKDGGIVNGITTRIYQEKADKCWVIDTVETKTEAQYLVELYSVKYGIPNIILNPPDTITSGIKGKDIVRLFDSIDTHSGAERLAHDIGLNLDYPTALENSNRVDYEKIMLVMQGSSNIAEGEIRKSKLYCNTKSTTMKNILEKYMQIKENNAFQKKSYSCCIESHHISYLKRILVDIEHDCREAGIDYRVYEELLSKSKRYKFVPFSNMKAGLSIPVYNSKNKTMARDTISSIKVEKYKGKVYDISVPLARNFIANEVVVHNCIYQWRGADPSIILNICADYDIMKFTLTTNYRCAGNIVEKAAVGITHNTVRSDKTMKPFRHGGDIKICDCGSSNLYTMSKYAYKHIKDLVIEKQVAPNQVAVLSRNNNHLCILGNMLFKDGIHCDVAKEMKMTRLPYYKAIKDVLSLARNTKNGTVTENTLYKVCSYLKKSESKILSEIQTQSGMRLSDLLGYLCKYYFKVPDATFDQTITMPSLTHSSVSRLVSRFRDTTVENLVLLYRLMTDTDLRKRSTGLLICYLTACEYQFKDNMDKRRTAEGLVDYISDLILTMGFEETRQFLRVSEQYEEGRMAIPGAKVCMSTMHGSKGKEWDHVVLFADDNVTFPSFSGITTQLKQGIAVSDIYHGIDENRRLHYVAMTRARKELAIFTDKSNVGLYLLEAMGIFDFGINNNKDIITMAQSNGVYSELTKKAGEIIFSDDSVYNYKLEVPESCGEIEIDYIYRGNDSKKTVSIDDIQTAPPQKLVD